MSTLMNETVPLTVEVIRETARRLGLRFKPNYSAYYDRRLKTCCPGGIAAIILYPELLDREFLADTHILAAGMSATMLRGYATGFDGDARVFDVGVHPDYDHAFTIGRAIRYAEILGLPQRSTNERRTT
jgi:hypothetical protein